MLLIVTMGDSTARIETKLTQWNANRCESLLNGTYDAAKHFIGVRADEAYRSQRQGKRYDQHNGVFSYPLPPLVRKDVAHQSARDFHVFNWNKYRAASAGE